MMRLASGKTHEGEIGDGEIGDSSRTSGLMGTVTGFYCQLLWNRPQQPRAAISPPNGRIGYPHATLAPKHRPPQTANHPNSVTDKLKIYSLYFQQDYPQPARNPKIGLLS